LRTVCPKDDNENDTPLTPALVFSTAASNWNDDDTPLGSAESSLYGRPVPMDKTFEDVNLPSFEEESKVESIDEESVFNMMG
jgi:hypothetical protein